MLDEDADVVITIRKIIMRNRKKNMWLKASPLALAILFGVPAASFGQTSPQPPTVEQGQQMPAEKFIQDLGDKAIAVVANKSLTPSQRDSQYQHLLAGAFDMKTIGRFVLGRAWNTATPQQQQDYLKVFDDLVVKTYGEKLNFYHGEGFKVKSFRPESDKDVVVNSEITRPNGPPTSVDWRVRQTDGKYAIIDVVVEGISQSVTQRQEYASVLEHNNNNIDALISMMRQKLQQSASNSQPTQ
jgi:phospholipid transport system substrate-binding protein